MLETTSRSFVPGRPADQFGNTSISASEPSPLASLAKPSGRMIDMQGTETSSTYWPVHLMVYLSSTRLFTGTTTIGRGDARRPTGCLLANSHSSTWSIHSTLQRTPGSRELLRPGTHRGTGKLLASKPSCFRSRPPHVAFVPPTPRSHTDR